MSRPLFTVVIPTIGRPSLDRTLESINRDLADVLIVADTHEMTTETLANLGACAGFYGVPLLEHDAGRHDTGNAQIGWAFPQAKGRWLLNVGDDDVYEPGAFETMARAIEEQDGPPHPLMFKVELHPNAVRMDSAPVVLWSERRIKRFVVTGQSFVCPNDPERFGDWETDWRFMQGTVANYGGLVDWRDELTVRCY